MQGGCGACTVMLTYPDPRDPSQLIHRSCNSCLRLLASVDGTAITTTEGLGSKCVPRGSTVSMLLFSAWWFRSKGFHPVQQRIAEHNGLDHILPCIAAAASSRELLHIGYR